MSGFRERAADLGCESFDLVFWPLPPPTLPFQASTPISPLGHPDWQPPLPTCMPTRCLGKKMVAIGPSGPHSSCHLSQENGQARARGSLLTLSWQRDGAAGWGLVEGAHRSHVALLKPLCNLQYLWPEASAHSPAKNDCSAGGRASRCSVSSVCACEGEAPASIQGSPNA